MYSYRHSVLYVDLCVYFREISPALLPCESCTVHSAKSSDRRPGPRAYSPSWEALPDAAPCHAVTVPMGRLCLWLRKGNFIWGDVLCLTGVRLLLWALGFCPGWRWRYSCVLKNHVTSQSPPLFSLALNSVSLRRKFANRTSVIHGVPRALKYRQW